MVILCMFLCDIRLKTITFACHGEPSAKHAEAGRVTHKHTVA